MKAALPTRGLARHVAALVGSVAAVAIVTGALFAFKTFAPVLSLGVLYVFAVLPIAIVFGLGWGLVVSVASMLAFNWFFLPPVYTFTLQESENWFALAVYLFTAVIVSWLAATARRRARESALLAEIAASLLEHPEVHRELDRIGEQAARALQVESARIDLEGRVPAGEDTLSARGGRPPRRRDPPRRTAPGERRRAPAPPARPGVDARDRDRPRAPRPRSARGRGAPPERCDEDGRAARCQPRPAHAADGDPRVGGRAGPPGSKARQRGPGRARGDDPRRGHAPGSSRRQPARPLAPPGGSRPARADALADGRSRHPGGRGDGRRRPAGRDLALRRLGRRPGRRPSGPARCS